MIASNVTFTAKTLAELQNPTLSMGRRARLRRQALKDYINSLPYGTPLSYQEIGKYLHYPKGTAAAGLINTMLDKHELERFPAVRGHKATFFYTVPGPVTVKQPASDSTMPAGNEAATPQEPEAVEEPTVDPQPPSDGRADSLERLAQRFIYFYNVDAASIKEFVRWVRSQEVA